MKTNILHSIRREKEKILAAPQDRSKYYERYKRLDEIERKIHKKYRYILWT